MAHECPECGLMCHCGGDIDDCCFNFDEYVDGCTHCDPDDDPDRDNEDSMYFDEDVQEWIDHSEQG